MQLRFLTAHTLISSAFRVRANQTLRLLGGASSTSWHIEDMVYSNAFLL
jgi:hypothetical protein